MNDSAFQCVDYECMLCDRSPHLNNRNAQSPSRSSVRKQAVVLHQCIASLMREFRLEPGLLAGSPYAELHASDVEMFELLTQPGVWNVRAISRALHAPMTTISSALDRLEKRGLICRLRATADRRKVCVGVTTQGKVLASRLRNAHIRNCGNMLLRLAPTRRDEFLCLVSQISQR